MKDKKERLTSEVPLEPTTILKEVLPKVEVSSSKPKELNPVFDDSSKPSLSNPKTIINHVNGMREETEKAKHKVGIFTIKTANQWIEEAKAEPIPKMLFSEFWLESEICILFADTNMGKSILAVQIGDSISKGSPVKGFKLEAKKQPVLYFDFELSKKQFEGRYSKEYEQHYRFDDNFIRVDMHYDAEIPKGEFAKYFNASLVEGITKTKAKVLIIDNLTYLGDETEKSKNAVPLMQNLKALKNKYNLSILVLAHTPKRDLSKPITRNDLAGSKMLINFCDNAFTIGESCRDTGVRYIKHIKARSTEKKHHTNNVVVCEISKEFNFLGFDFLDFGDEREHLRQSTDAQREELEKTIIDVNNKNPMMSIRAIAANLKTNPARVQRTLDKLKTIPKP